jgi:hypothetical protein
MGSDPVFGPVIRTFEVSGFNGSTQCPALAGPKELDS